MRVFDDVTAMLDDPNPVSRARLAPVLQLVGRDGLQRLVGEHVHLAKPGGDNAHLKRPALIARVIAGADAIFDLLDNRVRPVRLFGPQHRPWAGVNTA